MRPFTDRPEVTETLACYGERRAWDLSKSGVPTVYRPRRKIPDGSDRFASSRIEADTGALLDNDTRAPANSRESGLSTV